MNTRYICKCHERMGNDFWFLPRDACLHGLKCNHTLVHTVAAHAPIEEHIEAHATPVGERDPFRGGQLT
jgi:hypothetical protein